MLFSTCVFVHFTFTKVDILTNSMLYTQNVMTCYQNATNFSMKVTTKNYHNFVKFLHRQVGGIGGFSSDKKQRVARGGIETT